MMKSVTVSPHVHSSLSTDKAMLYVIIALLPSALWGVFAFGLRALIVLLVSIVSAVLTEYLLGKVSKENTIRDYSAIVTGLLVGMNMSPIIPLYIPVIASVFAIAVVKWTFGGLGCNWMNPALAGRVFVFFSFSSKMSTFVNPWYVYKPVDSVSSATILSTIKTAVQGGATGANVDILSSASIAMSHFGSNVENATGINGYVVDAFFGNIAGCIGEVSALLLLVGGIFLIAKHIITWHIPVVFIGSFAVLSWIFGGLPRGLGLFSGEVVLPVLTGGLMLGAFFMATDWVTSPTTKKGEIIYAFGCGFFTFLLRYFASLPEGVSIAILLMNIVTPTIDRYIKPKKFGYVKPEKKKKGGESK